MTIKNKILLATVCMTLGGCSFTPWGAEAPTGEKYTPRPDLAPSQYSEVNHWEDYMDRKSYNEYEHREPCQDYRMVPRNTVVMCDEREPMPEPVAAPRREVQQETRTVISERRMAPIVSSYTIYFDFDKSNIRDSEEETLQRVAREISQFKPSDVTVTGHADRAGSPEYNQVLSRKRADAVSQLLTSRGIPNQVIDEEARGESDPAVPTPDGVRAQENRRVTIDFRKQ